ncbi:MAG: Ni/Fe-hydrogenase, b-type cytochrome subunit [Nitrospiraceae bacterium]|nr:MAG: Ni/Fe-hydrogenase, b-type cytochrome subunit [Nitrospiraceae bacterium]
MAEQRIRVYAWEFPVRLCHWINVLSILTLSVTGYYIGDPFIHATSSKQYIMGWMRFIHFTAAYTFMMSVIIRLYWSIAGNRYASIRNWFPFTPKRLSAMGTDIRCYLLIGEKGKCHPGHTQLGGLSYLIVNLMYLFMIFSGFAMYAAAGRTGALWTVLGGWLLSIMSLQTARLLHHLVMYFILVFAMIHVYISWFSDSKEKSGMMGSIFTGYKYVTQRDWE